MDRPLAMGWRGFMENDRSFEAAVGFNWAKTLPELIEYIKKCDSLVTSLTFAFEKTGDIGYWATGAVPKRKSILESLYIRNGTLPENDWTGFYPQDENPHVVNPKEGFASVLLIF